MNMTLITTMLSQVLEWLTQVATWFISPGNEMFVIPFAIAIGSMVIGLMIRVFRRKAG